MFPLFCLMMNFVVPIQELQNLKKVEIQAEGIEILFKEQTLQSRAKVKAGWGERQSCDDPGEMP